MVNTTKVNQVQPRATSESALSASCRARAAVCQLPTPTGISLARSLQEKITNPEELSLQRTPLSTLRTQLRERFKGESASLMPPPVP